MARTAAYDRAVPLATNGEIAALNLESACRGAWRRFTENPRAPNVAEMIVDMERLKLQFLGDLGALDRLEILVSQLTRTEDTSRAALVQAEVASGAHRFAEARDRLAHAASMGAPREEIERQMLTIDQACGVELDRVLAARRAFAARNGGLADLVPLGAVLADLEHFAEADGVYQQALFVYGDTSPFPLAWICFQLGALWGELVPAPKLDLATHWYRRAIAYVPGYAKARVHLAEILMNQGQADDAEALLLPALSSRDPEVRWRLGDVLIAQGKFEGARAQLDAARLGFEELLERHLLAFADHAAEFYAGSGGDRRRALALAQTNATNRPTRRAIELAEQIVVKSHVEDAPFKRNWWAR